MMINKELMNRNECFGCGHDNEHGLQIEIRRSPEGAAALVGKLTPKPHMAGFPGIVHGGAIYAALDCLAAWTATMARPEKAIWILKSASVRYLRPTLVGGDVTLSGEVIDEAGEMEPVSVKTEARDEAGKRLVEAKFTVVPLPREKFLRVSGLESIPDNWVQFMDAEFSEAG